LRPARRERARRAPLPGARRLPPRRARGPGRAGHEPPRGRLPEPPLRPALRPRTRGERRSRRGRAALASGLGLDPAVQRLRAAPIRGAVFHACQAVRPRVRQLRPEVSMPKRRFRLPSPALVISMIALSLVLGGTAVAASTAKHSDKKADIKLIKKLAPTLSV